MADIESLKQKIAEADEERLRELVAEWIGKDESFAEFMESKLNPGIESIDFDAELCRGIAREAYNVSSRHSNTSIMNWSNIYYYQVKPWTDKAEELSTLSLMRLVVAITVRIAMTLTDEDFYGDDWNGDDYSMEIGSIMDALGNTAGILLVREDLPDEYLNGLKGLVEDAEREDVTSGYVGNPYDVIKEMVAMRTEAGEITLGMFDSMVKANFDHKGGEWMCRKIDFVENMGLTDEAWQLAEDNIKYPQVAIKLYLTLTKEENWTEAMKLIDRIIEVSNGKEYREYRYGNTNDWMEIKQKLLREHGTSEEQIANLRQLFLNSPLDYEKYYDELKESVAPNEWKTFFKNLLSEVDDYSRLHYMGALLAKEGEQEWLFMLLHDYLNELPTDYKIILKTMPFLVPTYKEALKIMLTRSVKDYATSRFATGQRVKSGTYGYFCNDLQKLSELGFSDLLSDLIRYFREEYGTRPAFMSELRRIKVE